MNGDQLRGGPFGVQVTDTNLCYLLDDKVHSAGKVDAPLGVAVNNRDEIAVTEVEKHRVPSSFS